MEEGKLTEKRREQRGRSKTMMNKIRKNVARELSRNKNGEKLWQGGGGRSVTIEIDKKKKGKCTERSLVKKKKEKYGRNEREKKRVAGTESQEKKKGEKYNMMGKTRLGRKAGRYLGSIIGVTGR